jgi:ubiquinone/menaquinone biosynthesis C-methylase UbiE
VPTEADLAGGAGTSAKTSAPASTRWADADHLRNVQYATPANFAARQAIYRFQQPRIRIYDWALDLAELQGGETIIDVGCGNGAYLAALRRRKHAGLTLGLDFSAGMLEATRGPAREQLVAQADARKLPLKTQSADAILSMHMLYHVPQPATALTEFRRALKPGGKVLAVLNVGGHLAELDKLIDQSAAKAGLPKVSDRLHRLDLDEGERLLRTTFPIVERHVVTAELVVTDPKAIVDYVASISPFRAVPGGAEAIMPIIEATAAAHVADDGAFRMTTKSGCLVCH